jgi:MATE family multidrug resistance protein
MTIAEAPLGQGEGRHAKSLSRRFWRLASLNILSNLMVPLAGLVDMALLGHLGQIRYLAGVALGAILFDYVYWTFGFLRMGTTGMTAQAVGRENADEVAAVALRGMALALGLGILILALQKPLSLFGFWVLQGDAGVKAAGLSYFAARIWGAPAVLVNFVLLGWFLGREQARRVLVMSIVGNLSNVILDFYFVAYLHMSAGGVGAASAIAQYLMLISALVFALKDLPFHRIRRVIPLCLSMEGLRATFSLNNDILVRTLALISVFALFTNIASAMGAVVLAATAVVKQVVTLAAFFIDGYAFATESLAGIFEGGADRRRLRRLLSMSALWSAVTGLLFAAGFMLFPALFRLLTDHGEVLSQVNAMKSWLLPVLGVGSIAYALDGYFIGLVRGRILRTAMVLSALVGFAPLAWFAYRAQNIQLLWLALSTFMLARVLSLAIFVPSTLRQGESAN